MHGREECDKIEKMKKFFRLFKYIALSIVFVVFAFLRWVSGGQSSDLVDHKKLSKDDLKNSLPHFPEVNADVPGGDGGGDGGDGDGGSSGDGDGGK